MCSRNAVIVRASGLLRTGSIVLLVLQFAACRSAKKQDDATPHTSRDLACDPAEVVAVSSGDKQVAVVDLDCDGVSDSVTVTWKIHETGRRPTLTVHGSLGGEISTEGDFLPELVSFGDLDSDGMRDILVVSVTESSVFAEVVMVHRDGDLSLVTFPSLSLRRAMQYRFHDVGWSSGCLGTLMPRLERLGTGGLAVSLATGDYRREGDCARARRQILRVVDQRFEPVEER